MSVAKALRSLAAAGTEQNREVYERNGAIGEVFGVGPASLERLASDIGTNHALAKQLWATKNAEARLLATRIADASRIQAAELYAWAKDLDWYVGADALAKLAYHTKHAREVALRWLESEKEWVARAGWHTLALLTRDKKLPDTFFDPMVRRITKDIHGAPNRVRDAMNLALIAIGIRSDGAAKTATRAAKAIGSVKVDYGDASVRTPNAELYIRRGRAFLENVAKKAAPEAKARAAKKKNKPKKQAKKSSTKRALPQRVVARTKAKKSKRPAGKRR